MTKRRGTTWRRLAVAVAAALLALLAAACGGPSSNGEAAKAPNQILSDAKQATLHASSVHISGAGSDGGQPLRLDIVVSHSAAGGTFSLSGGSFSAIVMGPATYIKADPAFLRQQGASAAVASLLGGRWLKTTTTDPRFGDLAKLLNLSSIVQSMKPTGAIHKGKTTTTFDHQSAVPLVDSSGGTLYVAGTGQPHILGAREKGQGLLTFDQYGSARVPSAPSGAVDIGKLAGQGGA